MADFVNKLKSFDAYPKTLDDFRVKTYSGAAVSLISGIFILFLFVSEFAFYLQTDVHHELFVDTTFGEKMQINIDVTFHRLPCSYLSIDAMDISGEHQLDVDHNIFKKRLDKEGRAISGVEQERLDREKPKLNPGAVPSELPPNYCGSCYGAEQVQGQCCNTCDEVREAYRQKGWAFSNHEGIEQCLREGWSANMLSQADEGCNLSGNLKVNKVAGNVHVAPGKSFQQHHMHVHDLQPFHKSTFNISHTVERLSFGKNYPGIVNPLDGVSKYSLEDASVMYQYFIKIVPTVYTREDGIQINTNQFSVTEHSRVLDHRTGAHGLPGVFFMYDVSPMVVRLTENRRSFASFLTGVCAIIGGVFTVAGLVDSFIYHTMRSLGKKLELGKHS